MANIAVRALRLAARTQQPLLCVTQVRNNYAWEIHNNQFKMVGSVSNKNIDPGKAVLHKPKLVKQLWIYQDRPSWHWEQVKKNLFEYVNIWIVIICSL